MVEQGTFREDLYYRINVINIQLPPLRERLEDLPLLIEHFIQKFRAKRNRDIRKVSNEVLQLLRGYDFPGNVRELENAIERAFVICPENIIEVEHLPEKILKSVQQNGETSQRPAFGESSEASIIREALTRNHGNRTKTAEELGMHRGSLWRKLKKYNIDYP
jgi:transcriptional regulator with PAS, ATPase and Fis domain